ncbi:MAG: NAD(+)--dinitrogen-reductase ADP-D-ribosyltransferase [Verrucomicrobiales bacterium]|nr:NAD(+)--dinitrogen-reductase ADP-D-ribosyltransferase [Verrucomicrobiales bacterium]
MRGPEKIYHETISRDESRSSCALNRCNLPPWIIGSEEFQANPQPIDIDGARLTDPWLFRRLEQTPEPDERSRIFHEYVCVKFSLDEVVRSRTGGKPKRVYSYVHLLRAWGADSNGPAGAVLKAWVESRFGLLATYHHGRLVDDSAARDAFRVDRMRGASRAIGVLMQLDLLYTFCQDELRRRFPGHRWKTLYRGTHDPEEYVIREQAPHRSASAHELTLVQLNNLSSFTSDPEVAWEFGSHAWEAQVPLAKIVFFSGLLPRSCLAGEAEHIVLGGYYRIRPRLY